MKKELRLAKSLIGKKGYYLVIDDTFYMKITKKRYYELAKFFNIKVN